MQVSGSAVVNVVPDRASIQLGVQSNAATVAEVEQINSAATQNVLKALRNIGIEEKDLATDRYVIEPVYENYDSLRIRGYRINNLVAVTLRDVSQTRPAISGSAAGRRQPGGRRLILLQPTAPVPRPGACPGDDGRRREGRALAQAAGAQTGSVLTISENSWSYFNGMWGGSSNSRMAQNVVQNIAPTGSGAAKGDEPISLGMISIHAEVGVTYSLK